jgi:hypothetical protein
MCAEKQSDIPR